MKHIFLIALLVLIAPLNVQAQEDSAPVEEATPVEDSAPANDIEVKHVSEGIYVLISPQGGNVVASVGEDGTFLIDDQLDGRSPLVKEAAQNLSGHDIQFILNTHYHFDHTGGNTFFGEENAVIVAHDNVRKRLSSDQFITYFNKEMKASPKVALPVITFAQDMKLHTNGDEVSIIHVPNAHTDGDAIAHFKNANVIAAGDLIFNGMYPFIDTEHGGSIKGEIAGLDLLLSMADAQTQIVPGHGAVMRRAELQTYRDALATIAERVEAGVRAGQVLGSVLESQPTKEFDATMGGGFVGPEAFVSIVYGDFSNQ